MSKFKIGDSVRITHTDYVSPELRVGQTGVLVTVNDRGVWGLQMDNGFQPGEWAYLDGHPAWSFEDYELEPLG